MKTFNYKGYDDAGASISGIINAADKEKALSILSAKKFVISSITEELSNVSESGGGRALGLKDKLYLIKELSMLMSAGMRLDKSLSLIAENAESIALKRISSDLAAKIRAGSSVSIAFGEYSTFFGEIIVTLLKVAEESGDLSKVLGNIAKDLEYQSALRSRIITALTYPLVIFCVSVCSVVFILNYVVPNISTIFAGKDNIPTYTYVLLQVSDFFIKYQLFMLIGLIVSVYASYRYRHVVFENPVISDSLLNLPIVGSLVLQSNRIRFTDTVSLMLKSGVVLDKAMQLSINGIRNRHLRNELDIAVAKLKQGEKLSTILSQTITFSKYYGSIIAVGEETGQLEEVFSEVSNRSRKSFEESIGRITTLLEPLMIVFMGGIVGTIVVIMIASITSASDIAL